MRVSFSNSCFSPLNAHRLQPKQPLALLKRTSRWASSVPGCRFRERIEHVRVGGTGSIPLRFGSTTPASIVFVMGCLGLLVLWNRIIEPLAPPPTANAVTLYLPPGPLFPQTDELSPGISGGHNEGDPAQQLAAASSTTTVTINYRLGSDARNKPATSFKFPMPVHDTMAGFDWIFRTLDTSQINVFGKHIGGSLALMLALTESRSIAAVAVQDPVCDWVGLDDYCIIESGDPDDSQEKADISRHEGDSREKKRRIRKKKQSASAPADLVHLLKSRNTLFHKPHNYFDSFASPALLLRTAGKYCPSAFPALLTGPEYQIPVIQPAPEKDAWALSALLLAKAEDQADLPELAKHTIRRRRVLSRWPPVGSDYRIHSPSDFGRDATEAALLPNVKVFIHSNSFPTANQNEQTPSDALIINNLSNQLEKTSLSENGPPKAPDDQDLPSTDRYIRHASTRGSIPDLRNIEEETVLAAQGIEMVELMRSACFWGREPGFGSERVSLERIPYHILPPNLKGLVDENGVNGAAPNVQRQVTPLIETKAGEWFSSLRNQPE